MSAWKVKGGTLVRTLAGDESFKMKVFLHVDGTWSVEVMGTMLRSLDEMVYRFDSEGSAIKAAREAMKRRLDAAIEDLSRR